MVKCGSCVMDCDLKGCLRWWNIDFKRDEKWYKIGIEKLLKEYLVKNMVEVIIVLDIIRNLIRKNFDRFEIFIEGIFFNC